MDATTTKDLLHLRIEQADEKLLAVLAEVTESLFRSYQPEAVEVTDPEHKLIGYQAGEPLTTDELRAKINRAEDQIDRGEYLSPEELEKEAEGWLSESIA